MSVIDNFIELATVSQTLTGARGVYLSSTAASARFGQVVIRKNVIRDVQTPLGTTSGIYGLSLERCGELLAENNILDNIEPDKAVWLNSCDQFKFFNNQTSDGQLLRAYNSNIGRYVLELEDEVQNVLLAS